MYVAVEMARRSAASPHAAADWGGEVTSPPPLPPKPQTLWRFGEGGGEREGEGCMLDFWTDVKSKRSSFLF